MTATGKEKHDVTLPDGVSLPRVAPVLLEAWGANPRRWMDAPMALREDLATAAGMPEPQDALDLFRLLAERRVNYLLVGGLAMLTYVKGRNTKDVTLLLSLEAVREIPELEIRHRQDFFARAQFRSLQVDLWFTFNPLFKTVAEKHATVHRVAELSVPAATVEGLIIMRLYALPSLYRQFDMDRAAFYENDLTMLIANYSPALTALLATASSDMEAGDKKELKKIISEGCERAEKLRHRASQ